MKPLLAAAFAATFLSGLSGQTTYQQSMDAKKNAPCVRQALSKFPEMAKFVERYGEARYNVQQTLYNHSLTDKQKLSRLLKLPGEYGECIAAYSLFNPASEDLYRRKGRQKPPLTGPYEEQARILVEEVRWEINSAAENTKQRNLNAARTIRTVQDVKKQISDLPNPVSADINIDSWHATGRIYPRFNLEYGERGGTILISLADEARPQPGETTSEYSAPPSQRKYLLISRRAGPHSLVALNRDGSVSRERSGHIYTWNAYSRDALTKYRNWEDSEGISGSLSGKLGGLPRFAEFSKFMDGLGTGFDGSARFKMDQTSGWHGGRPHTFTRFGFKGSSNNRNLGAAAYYVGDFGDLPDGTYLKLFSEDFLQFSVGGRRQFVHIDGSARGMQQMPGMRKVQSEYMPGQMVVILEER